MKKAVLVTLLLLFPVQTFAAIAFDAATTIQDNGGSTASLVFNETVTGANPTLIIGCVNLTGNTDAFTGITYNSVAMTRIESKAMPDTPEFTVLYALPAASTGTNSVSVSISPSQRVQCRGSSYTGTSQTLPLDAHTNNYSASATALSSTLNTIANNSWTVAVMRTSNTNTVTADSGTTLRDTLSKSFIIGDSNGPITPAGSTSLGLNSASAAGPMANLMVSIAPASSGTAPFQLWPFSPF